MERSRRTLAVGFALAAPAFVGLAVAETASKDLPAAEAQAFVEYIIQIHPYEEWPLWPGKDKLYKGTEPHGALLTTYVNESALGALKEKSGSLPAGSIIVKENYTPAKELAAVTAMYRVEGYNPQAGDFFWIKFFPDGKVDAAGKVESCIACHSSAPGEDFLFTGDVK